jgi:hypothetical protein
MCHSEERSDEESQASDNRRRIEIPHFVRNDMAYVLRYTYMF